MRTLAEQLAIAEEILSLIQHKRLDPVHFTPKIRAYFGDHQRGELISDTRAIDEITPVDRAGGYQQFKEREEQ
jgi:hypothetical protein